MMYRPCQSFPPTAIVLVGLGILAAFCTGFSSPTTIRPLLRSSTLQPPFKFPRALFASFANATAETTNGTPQTLSKNEQSLSKRIFPRTWVPMASVYELDPNRPTPLEFLDQNYVTYKDTQLDQWIVVDDVCPHRLAPLSEGRIQKDPTKTTLMCSYHGWEFNNDGSCANIPQASPSLKTRACQSPKSSVQSYSTQVHKNILWVWPWPEDCLSIAQDFPAKHPEGIMSGIVGGGDNPSTYTRDMPYGWDTLVENLIDPAHIPFAHHGLQGKREDAIPIDMTLPQKFENDTSGEQGFLFEWQDRTMGKHRAGTGEFMAPYGVAYQGSFYASKDQAEASKGTHLIARTNQFLGKPISETTEELSPFRLGVLCIPTKPGWSRVITTGSARSKDESEEGSPPAKKKPSLEDRSPEKKKPSLAAKLLGLIPQWVIHLLSNKALDSDLAFLHFQEQERLKRMQDGSSSAYYVPTASDRCISAFRNWIPQHTDYLEVDASRLPPPIQDRSVLFNRYQQHTAHCKHCQEGLKTLQTTVRKAAYFGLVTSVLAGHCFQFFRGFKLVTKIVALLSLGILRLVAKIEPAFKVGGFKHYENH